MTLSAVALASPPVNLRLVVPSPELIRARHLETTRQFNFETDFLDYPVAILVVDQETSKVVAINGHFSSRIGYSDSESIGRSVNSFVPKSVRGKHSALMESFWKNPTTRAMGSRTSQVSILLQDGREAPAEIALMPSTDGKHVAVIIQLLSNDMKAYHWKKVAFIASLVIAVGVMLEVLNYSYKLDLPDGGGFIYAAIGALLSMLLPNKDSNPTK